MSTLGTEDLAMGTYDWWMALAHPEYGHPVSPEPEPPRPKSPRWAVYRHQEPA